MIIPNTTTLFFFFNFEIDEQEEITNNFKIGNYFILHLIAVVVIDISTDLLTCPL